MAVVSQLFHQNHFILYLLILLCLLSTQFLVQSQRVTVTTYTNGKPFKTFTYSIHSKTNHHKRNVPLPLKSNHPRSFTSRNVILDKNSYVALLYIGGFALGTICLIFFPSLTRKPYQYLKNVLKYTKVQTLTTTLRNIGDVILNYIKHYVEIVLKVLNIKLIFKIVSHLFQYLKSLIIVYS